MLTFRSAQKVRIFADPEMPWTLDGEKEDGHETVDVYKRQNIRTPLALPPGELSPKVTER